MNQKNNRGRRKGVKLSDATKNKMAESHKGIGHTEATKKILREKRAKQIMKPMSEATKKKIGLANKGRPNPRKGTKGLQHHSDATKKKISENNKAGLSGFQKGNQVNLGRKLTQDHKDKITEFNKKRWQDPKYRKHMLKIIKVPTTLGTTQSPETIAKRMKTMKPIFSSEDYKSKLREKRLHQTFPQKDSKPEKMVQLYLDVNQIKYQKHVALIGQPDIFIEPNICIFIDGCYWHACQSCHPEIEKKYPKLVKQILTDSKVTHELTKQGYIVLRYWEHDIVPEIDSNNMLRIIQSKKEVYHGT